MVPSAGPIFRTLASRMQRVKAPKRSKMLRNLHNNEAAPPPTGEAARKMHCPPAQCRSPSTRFSSPLSGILGGGCVATTPNKVGRHAPEMFHQARNGVVLGGIAAGSVNSSGDRRLGRQTGLATFLLLEEHRLLRHAARLALAEWTLLECANHMVAARCLPQRETTSLLPKLIATRKTNDFRERPS